MPFECIKNLLQLALSAGFFQLLDDFVSSSLVDVLLDGLGSVIDQILGFLKAKAGDLTDDLDDVDLLVADFLEHNGELGLLFSSGSACAGSGSNGNGSSGGYAELFLQSLYQLGKLKNGKSFDFFDKLGYVFASHIDLPPK